MNKAMRGVVKSTFYIILLLSLIIGPSYYFYQQTTHLNIPISLNLSTTVQVHTEPGSTGTGIVFINEDKIFVWTCAHVIADSVVCCVKVNLNNGKAEYHCHVKAVQVGLKLFNEDDEEYGEIRVWAKIIRFSTNDDLALLELPKNTLFKNSVKFPLKYTYKMEPGSRIFHIGCMRGDLGHKSISEGIHGLNGLQLEDNNFYCRLGLGIQPGSSGGGVFDLNGTCIGIAARSLDRTSFNQCFMIGFARMAQFAQRLDCEWAINNRIKVPTDYLDKITDDKALIPHDFLKQFIR